MGLKGITMNKTNLLVRYDKDLRLRIMYPEARKEITDDVVRIIRRAPGMNVVSFTFVNERDLHRVIHNELEYFLPMQQPFTWKVYDHDLLPSLKGELQSHGFSRDDDPTDVMVLDVKKAPVFSPQPDDVEIHRIDTVDELQDVSHVLDRVWGSRQTWINDLHGAHLRLPGSVSIYAAYVDEQLASIAWTYFPHGQFAMLSAGATLAEYRGQGLFSRLLAKRLQEIGDRGYRYAVVEADPMSRSLVANHGFQHLTTVHDFKWNGN